MATAKQQRRKRSSRRTARWPGILLLAALLAAGLAWYLRETLMDQAVAGAAFGARMACSCRYIGGRDLNDCRKDFVPGMAMIRLSEDRDAQSITASFPLLASQTATYRQGPGCLLQPWDR